MKEESVTHYRTMVGVRREKMEKQIGCMSGFLQIFDRQQLLAGKRIHSNKRLPPSTFVGASPEAKSSGESQVIIPSSLDNFKSSVAEKATSRSKSPVMVRTSSLKSSKEMHRHSLDNKVTASKTMVADEVESQPRSPSVIARLMGLEPLSLSNQKTPQTVTKPSLKRSASESSVSRDQVHSKYIDDNNFQLKQPNPSQKQTVTKRDTTNGTEASRTTTSPWRSRSFFDSTDVFPDPNKAKVTMQEDFEKRLKIRGIDEQSNDDISTLKQILEVLQLKGLLRSSNHLSNNNNHRNFVYDRDLHFNESNIVVVKPIRSSASKADNQKSVFDSTTSSLKKDGRAVDRGGKGRVRVRASSPNRIESNLKACNSINKTKQSSYEVQRKDDKYSKKVLPNDSPKVTRKRNGSDHHLSMNRSFRNQKLTESISTTLRSSASTTELERSKWEGCREGKNIATESPPSSAMVIPSPVSVLDSGFDKDELVTPLHCIDLKATPAINHNDDNESPKLSPTISTQHEEFTSDDSNFVYISHMLQASQHLHEDPNLFFSIEKHLYNNNKSTSNVSTRQHKLIFDVVHEILNRNKQLPPWKTLIKDHRTQVKHIWSEFQKIREVNTSDGVLELVSGVIEKDIVKNSDWRDYPIETSEVILDVERMIFKDMESHGSGLGDIDSGEADKFRKGSLVLEKSAEKISCLVLFCSSCLKTADGKQMLETADEEQRVESAVEEQ
ncbi:hypothetical protein M8C21_026357, partial [Ambrosia artemisiifolia]